MGLKLQGRSAPHGHSRRAAPTRTPAPIPQRTGKGKPKSSAASTGRWRWSGPCCRWTGSRDTEDAKQHRQQLADGMWDAARAVIHRTAAEGAGTGTAHPPSDRQKDLHIFGHHPEQRADPYPEDAARATQRQRCTHADDVADPHRTAQCGTDSAQREKRCPWILFAKQRTERLLWRAGLIFRSGRKCCEQVKIKPAQQGEGDGPASPQQLHRPVRRFSSICPPHPV